MKNTSLSEALDELVFDHLNKVKSKTNKAFIYNYMNPNTSILYINADKIKERSKRQTIGSNGRIYDSHRISYRQAVLIAHASVNYYIKHIKVLNLTSLSKAIGEAMNEPMKVAKHEIFSSIYDDKTNKMTTTMSRARLIMVNPHECIIIAPSYESVKRYSKKFSMEFEKFLAEKNQGSFYGLTKGELKRGERSSSIDVADVFRETDESFTREKQKSSLTSTLNKSSVNLEKELEKIGLTEKIKRVSLKGKKAVVKYRATLRRNTSKLSSIKALLKVKITVPNFVQDVNPKSFIKPLRNLIGVPLVNEAIKTLEHAFFSKIKSIRKVFIVKQPKTKEGKNTREAVSKSIPIPSPILKRLKKSAEVRTESVEKTYTPGYIITLSEEDKGVEESCMLSTYQLLALNGRLNTEMSKALKHTMKKPALVYRKGRFADSVHVDSLIQGPDCSLYAYYSYMTRPYAVFDPKISNYNNLSSRTRNPRKIIGDTIRSLAEQVVRTKYTIHPIWSGGR